jgi:hypothetical protein
MTETTMTLQELITHVIIDGQYKIYVDEKPVVISRKFQMVDAEPWLKKKVDYIKSLDNSLCIFLL